MPGFTRLNPYARGIIVILAAILISASFAERAISAEDDSANDKLELTRRQKEILRGVAKYAPWDCPDRWIYELGSIEERCVAVREKMLDTNSWIHFLAYATLLEWSDAEAKKTYDILLDRFAKVESGKVRQNIIFLAALTAPDAKRKLEKIFNSNAAGVTKEDKTDAGCALAMLGHEKAARWFEKEFKGSECLKGKPVFTYEDYVRVEGEDNREVTLSYRSWEVLFRRPYFRKLYFLNRTEIYGMRRAARTLGQRDALLKKLLPLFPAKWPGHPGCDDFAMYMLNFAIADGDLKSAYCWAQRTTLLPDQDCLEAMTRVLTAIAESQLSIAGIDEIIASEDGRHNLDFLRYTKFLAFVKDDKGRALEYFDKLASSDKHGFFAKARRAAAKASVPKGLRKGVDEALTMKILVDYPKRSKELGKTVWEPKEESGEDEYYGVLTYRERQVALRTKMVRNDSVTLDAEKVASQYRIILELSNLEKLEAAETDKAIKADLRYKQASIVYQNKYVGKAPHEFRLFAEPGSVR
jgi:hypothetical protein